MALTQKSVNSAKPKKKPYELRDGGKNGVVGLLLRVQPSGVKNYYCDYARGKRIRIGTHHLTLTQARTRAKQIRVEAALGNDPKKTVKAITLGDYIENIYKPEFIATHRSSLDNLTALKPVYHYMISKITANQIKDWRRKRIALGRAPSTINRNVTCLKTALNHAVADGYLNQNPLADLGTLKVEHPNRVRYLSEDEERRLRDALDTRERRLRDDRISGNSWRASREYDLLPDLSNLPFADHLKPMVILSMNTGMRRGELFNVKWADIVGDSLTITRSKSGKARHLPLNREACQILDGWRAMDTHTWVFESNGKPFDNVRKAWAGVLTEALITDFRWHDLRHHFASRLVMAGIPLNTVRELLGHADLKMTIRYAHLAPGHMREAVEAISR